MEGCLQVENRERRKQKTALKDENSEPFSFHDLYSVFLLLIS